MYVHIEKSADLQLRHAIQRCQFWGIIYRWCLSEPLVSKPGSYTVCLQETSWSVWFIYASSAILGDSIGKGSQIWWTKRLYSSWNFSACEKGFNFWYYCSAVFGSSGRAFRSTSPPYRDILISKRYRYDII